MITRNTSEGNNIVSSGLDLKSGDATLNVDGEPGFSVRGKQYTFAPTASTTAMLVMGDALAMAVLQARGFRLAIFPGGTARAVAHTLQGYYASLKAHGSTASWRDRMLDFEGLNAVIGTPETLPEADPFIRDNLAWFGPLPL